MHKMKTISNCFSENLIKRDGFRDCLWNYVVNLIENGELKDGYSVDNNEFSITVKKYEKSFVVTARAYINNKGWTFDEIEIPFKA